MLLGVMSATCLLVATTIVIGGTAHGPILLSISPSHGVDAGDLAAVPLVYVAALCARATWPRNTIDRRPARDRGQWLGPRRRGVGQRVVVRKRRRTRPDRSSCCPSGGGTFGADVGYVHGGAGLPVGRWSYLAATYDGAVVRLFVDGVEVAHGAHTGAIKSTSDPLWIGGNQPYGEYFQGTIDEVRVYDRALDPNAELDR